jgi:hypothetical protein
MCRPRASGTSPGCASHRRLTVTTLDDQPTTWRAIPTSGRQSFKETATLLKTLRRRPTPALPVHYQFQRSTTLTGRRLVLGRPIPPGPRCPGSKCARGRLRGELPPTTVRWKRGPRSLGPQCWIRARVAGIPSIQYLGWSAPGAPAGPARSSGELRPPTVAPDYA